MREFFATIAVYCIVIVAAVFFSVCGILGIEVDE